MTERAATEPIDYTNATGLDFAEPPRVDHRVRPAELARLFHSGFPFIVEESGSEAFERAAERFTFDRFRSVFGDRPWTVQRVPRGSFQPEVPFSEQTETVPFDAFLEKVARPEADTQHYLNIWYGPQLEFAQGLFDELLALSPELAMTRFGSQELRVFWLGGAGTVTPLHYDTYARSHGVLSGEKLFVLFPPDLSHYLKLKPFPFWTPVGWYSQVTVGPIDPAHHPRLAGTRPVRALCKRGDFLYLPPCWWHHVSIPSEPTLTISATFTPRRAYLYWYHWRLRFSRWFAGQDRLHRRNRAKRRAAAPVS